MTASPESEATSNPVQHHIRSDANDPPELGLKFWLRRLLSPAAAVAVAGYILVELPYIGDWIKWCFRAMPTAG